MRHPDLIQLNPDRFLNLKETFGLVKAKVLPPNNIPIAVLPFRNDKEKKVLYTLCRSCALDLNPYPCFHTEKERCWVGTYTNFELAMAVEHGYSILSIYEIWVWDKKSQSKNIFVDYLKTFFKLKIASEGFPSNCDTETKRDIYLKQINDQNELSLKKIRNRKKSRDEKCG